MILRYASARSAVPLVSRGLGFSKFTLPRFLSYLQTHSDQHYQHHSLRTQAKAAKTLVSRPSPVYLAERPPFRPAAAVACTGVIEKRAGVQARAQGAEGALTERENALTRSFSRTPLQPAQHLLCTGRTKHLINGPAASRRSPCGADCDARSVR